MDSPYFQAVSNSQSRIQLNLSVYCLRFCNALLLLVLAIEIVYSCIFVIFGCPSAEIRLHMSSHFFAGEKSYIFHSVNRAVQRSRTLTNNCFRPMKSLPKFS